MWMASKLCFSEWPGRMFPTHNVSYKYIKRYVRLDVLLHLSFPVHDILIHRHGEQITLRKQ
jgi:hypothetical protein